MKLFVIEIDFSHVRTIFTDKKPKIGDFLPEEIWLGHKISGGTITKIY